ncbi:MAG TPA: polysaccharide deacetylase family protein [Candidatus Angelobacter sp.]|nr:polysaccharide deacetylase family protein [Candidatus Angelobacter sp.]
MRPKALLRQLLKGIYVRLLQASGLLRFAKMRVAQKGVVVLTLHRVLPDAEFDSANSQPGMMVRACTFAALLDYIGRYCECVGVDEQLWDRQPERSQRPRIALTFDDGWKDNFETAFPIAQKHRARFAVFLCPEFVGSDQPFWADRAVALWREAQRSGKLGLLFELCSRPPMNCIGLDASADSFVSRLKQMNAGDRDECLEGLRTGLFPRPMGYEGTGKFLDWNEIQTMMQAGVSFGSHTYSHQILTQVAVVDAADELQSSKAAIESRLRTCDLLAYPNGDWSDEVREIAQRCGYQRAFANAAGVWRRQTNPLSIPRVNIWEGKLVDAEQRFSRMEMEYSVFWKAYRAMRREDAALKRLQHRSIDESTRQPTFSIESVEEDELQRNTHNRM